jgi:hypothetical protein
MKEREKGNNLKSIKKPEHVPRGPSHNKCYV